MIRRTSIGRVDRVSAPSQSNTGSGRSFEPSRGLGQEEQELSPGEGVTPEGEGQLGQEEKKPSPGRRTLSPEDVLSDEFLEKIERALENGEWDHGGVPVGDPTAGDPGQQNPINVGDIQAPEGEDVRIWGDPSKLEKDIDDAIKQGLENEEQAEKAEGKETKTTAEKQRGRGKGGGVRDRLQIETVAKTDWAAIFRTRLTAYSNEKSKYLPYNRRFVAGSRMPTAKLPDSIKNKDTLPELNVIIDTSSSLSYRELEVILAEIKSAMQAAKIKKLNILLWASSPYYHNSYKEVTSKDFDKVIKDIQDNWKGGGNNDTEYLQKILDLKWQKNFTINLTDGWIDDYTSPGSKTYELATKCFDMQNLIWGIIYPNKQLTMAQWESHVKKFPGTKLPIFLETKKFGQ